jgi:TonB dependent receptor
MSQSASTAVASFFADLPFSGEVNLLTTGAFAPGRFFSSETLPRGVAYVAIGAPTGAGDWAVRAAMSQGDLSSWILAGSFVSKREGIHRYNLGWSYSTQEYQGGNPLALAAVSDGNRNVGEIYGLDRWTIGPGVSVEYGGRYARYDYLVQPALFSPRVGVSLEPTKTFRITAVLAQRMVAPGAEEFLAPAVAGPWIPPERTFSPLNGSALRVERARDLDLSLEHDFGLYSVGVRRFFQNVDDQAMTLFGMRSPDGIRSVGHYYVAGAGSVDVDGWAVRLGSNASKRISGSVDYSLTHGRWNSFGDMSEARPSLAKLTRAENEDIHDLTTSLQAAIPETATRVFVLYKLNTGYARRSATLSETGLDARFDVQVNQALPFGLGSTKWEVLVGVRNLFRDPSDPASVYDELLVVRPPKRVVGGFLVRF